VHTAYISLGSNLGGRAANIAAAVEGLKLLPGTRFVRRSQIYETSPVGYESEHAFLNCVVELETALPPPVLLAECQRIEQSLGREHEEEVKAAGYADRVIDLDILLYGELVLATPDLIIPHPRLTERLFMLIPLAEVNEHIEIGGRTVTEWIDEVQRFHPEQEVKPYAGG
jgi:2-amino-4-hydroxy-6-hydroxymethyldihydropteridine diphosphokinase